MDVCEVDSCCFKCSLWLLVVMKAVLYVELNTMVVVPIDIPNVVSISGPLRISLNRCSLPVCMYVPTTMVHLHRQIYSQCIPMLWSTIVTWLVEISSPWVSP